MDRNFFVVLKFADIVLTDIGLIHALQRNFVVPVNISLFIIETGAVSNVSSKPRSWGGVKNINRVISCFIRVQ